MCAPFHMLHPFVIVQYQCYRIDNITNIRLLKKIQFENNARSWTFSLSFTQGVLIRRWSQQRRLLARDVNQRNSVLTNSYSLVNSLHFVSACIACIFSQLLNLKKYQEIKKSQNPSYLALAYLPQRQWMNYTTNRTLCLQSIHCPLRGRRK